MASNLLDDKGEKVSKKVQEAVGQNSFIRFGDVSAYTIRNGKLEDILDLENKLIGSTVIDSVSDEFDRVFDALMQKLIPNALPFFNRHNVEWLVKSFEYANSTFNHVAASRLM